MLPQRQKSMVIGLTGNSGAGKSTVAEIMKKNGAYILDCDKMAHENMQKGGSAYKKIVTEFGKDILHENGEIDRKKLGAIVFNDKNSLLTLNTVTHDIIKKQIINILAKAESRCTVIDAPLLEEAGLIPLCDEVWVVTAKLETRIRRITQRDGITKEAALLRFKNQKSDDALLKTATTVIKHDDDNFEKLEKEVIDLMKSRGIL